jgi:porin
MVKLFGRPGAFLIYAILTLAAYVFTRALVPETKGRSIEQIEADLHRQAVFIPARGLITHGRLRRGATCPRLLAGVTAFLLGFDLATAARAQSLDDWLQGDYMTGDWGGLRTKLENEGFHLRAHYLSETAGNPLGGLEQGTQYAQQIDFGVDLDLEKLVDLKGGKIHITFTDRAGRSLAADDIGNIISVQEIFGGGQNFRLAELSYEQSLFDGHVDAKVGWIHATDDFATSPIYCYFQNNGFCGQPAGIAIDSGITTFPVASWGGIVKLLPRSDLYFQAGAYEVNPSLSDPDNGFKLSTSGATGVIVPMEGGWRPKFGAEKLPGNYKLGAYYDTSDAPDLGTSFTDPTGVVSGRWGIYLAVDQMLFRETPGSERGLTAFGLFLYAHPVNALLEYYWEAGLLYRGTFPGRDQDTIGFAINQSRVSNVLIAAQNQQNAAMPDSVDVQSAETDIELNYRAQMTPWFSLMPNVQYVIHPNAVTSIPNAFVLGLQVGLTF